jgi:hypothetical protein
MEVVLLIKSLLGLVSILAILIFFLFYVPKKRKEKREQEEKRAQNHPKRKAILDYPSFKDLVKIVKNRESTAEDLSDALNLIIEHYGEIPPKLGIRAHPEFTAYAELIIRICRHPNTNKNIIVKFDRDLEKKNPAYKKEINDFLTKGLNSRG